MSTALSFLLLFLMALLLSVLWVVIAWSLVRLLNLSSPVARVFVLLAPLVASSVALLRLMPDARKEVLLVTVTIASLLSARDLLRYLTFRKWIVGHGRPFVLAEALCGTLSHALGVAPAPRVCLSDDLQCGPIALGLIRPTIVFPTSVAEQLSQEEVRVLLAHELAHIHRRDMLLKWMLLFMRRLAFWNPVALWPYRWVSLEIEFACDRIACRLTDKPGTLARTLCKIQRINDLQMDTRSRPLEMIPRADYSLRARIDFLGKPTTYHFKWSNLSKTLFIFSVYLVICSRPAEFLLSMID